MKMWYAISFFVGALCGALFMAIGMAAGASKYGGEIPFPHDGTAYTGTK